MNKTIFQNIPDPIQKRMTYMLELDNSNQAENQSNIEQLNQINPETGRFISIMATSSPDGNMIEIGTSGGYSTLWLSLACRTINRKITTFELSKVKIAIAKKSFNDAGVDDIVNLVEGDVRDFLPKLENISFCFLDTVKNIYLDCYKLVIERMLPGGIFVSDNAISHQEELQPMLDYVENDNRVDSLVVPIGSGLLLCRKNG